MKKNDVPKQLSISSSPVRGKTGLMLRGAGFRRKAIKVLHPPRLKVKFSNFLTNGWHSYGNKLCPIIG